MILKYAVAGIEIENGIQQMQISIFSLLTLKFKATLSYKKNLRNQSEVFTKNLLRNYFKASIFFTKFPFGCEPTSLSTTLPPFTNRIAGMLVMP